MDHYGISVVHKIISSIEKSGLCFIFLRMILTELFSLQANRKQSLNYGCIVENQQTDEVKIIVH